MIFSQASTVLTPFFVWRLDAENCLELFERHLFGLLGDADRALSLNVGMTANRADAGAGAADIAAQQSEVDQRLNGFDALPYAGSGPCRR